MADKSQDATFEALSERIDALVRQLEDNTFPLEEAVQAYEEGMQLLKRAQAKLEKAEQQVRLISAASEAPAMDGLVADDSEEQPE